MKESKIQKDSFALLATFGYLGLPIEYRGSRGCPDIMVFSLCRPAMVAFVELKTKNGKLSEIQDRTIRVYKWWGHDVGVCRTPNEVIAHVQKVFNGQSKTEETKAPVRDADNAQRQRKTHSHANAHLPA